MPHPSGRPWIVAHRGASHHERENTIAAFRRAAELGADAVELDARRTADGVVIVHHDPFLPGGDRPIVAMTRNEVALAAPDVPDLSEALAACRPMWVDIEIKNAPYEPDWDDSDATLDAVAGLAADNALISSFNPQTVARAAALGLGAGWLLVDELDPLTVLADWPGYRFVLPRVEALTGATAGAVVELARQVAAEVGVWTLDDPLEMRRLADSGVGMICTNRPDIAVSVFCENRDG